MRGRVKLFPATPSLSLRNQCLVQVQSEFYSIADSVNFLAVTNPIYIYILIGIVTAKRGKNVRGTRSENPASFSPVQFVSASSHQRSRLSSRKKRGAPWKQRQGCHSQGKSEMLIRSSGDFRPPIKACSVMTTRSGSRTKPSVSANSHRANVNGSKAFQTTGHLFRPKTATRWRTCRGTRPSVTQ